MNASDMMKLPPIQLADLSEKTKDYILGRASFRKCSPEEVILEVLDRASGFPAPDSLLPAAQPQPEGLAA